MDFWEKWETQKFEIRQRLLTKCRRANFVVKEVRNANFEGVEVTFESIWEPKLKVHTVKIH